MTARGIHHVTAIAGPARANLAFYAETLGLRLVKRTVNFDDPGTWHLYFGDEAGSPGTILTFFPWDNAAPGRLGVGETEETRLRVPAAALGFWTHRLLAAGIATDALVSEFGRSVLRFKDPHGTRLALVGVPGLEDGPAFATAEVPADHAIRGFEGVRLLLADAGPTARVLTEALGFVETGREGATRRFEAPGVAVGGIVDLREVGGFPRGRLGRGSVHHVAFRAADDADQQAIVDRLAALGVPTTEQKDRNYFRSVYFREPGGVIFEIATDDPGFAVDEEPGALGTALKLPSFLEALRPRLVSALPDLG